MSQDYFVYDVDSEHGSDRRYYLSPLSNEHVFKHGLSPQAIMGELTKGPNYFTHEHFQANAEFLRFLGWVIGKHARNCPALIAEAERQQNGYVYILDARTPTPGGTVPPEDILGGVEVSEGRPVKYHASPKYCLWTKDGIMQLDVWYREKLLSELVKLSNR